MIRLENVSKAYVTGVTQTVFPLEGVNLEAEEGQRIILLGKSGSGKSTFLNLVGGVDVPTTGRVMVNGRDLSAMSPAELALFRRREVGFVFQSFNLFSTLTVGENIMLPLQLLGIRDDAAAREMLTAVGLEGHWNKFPEQLSGGEQQRVAVARALVKKPRIVLADEPTGNLDLETGDAILELIHQSCGPGRATLIMATHSQDAVRFGDRTLRLRMGRLEELP
ncbi:MAG: ABC transporter ATP-binding protein [Pseudomonadota bacterium]